MSIVHANRQASVDEIAAEMDRRGAVIEKIEAERNLYKGKYRSMASLMETARSQIRQISDHIEDEGDRAFFGSTNHADWLKDLAEDMEAWVIDFELPKGDINKMERDPYATIREQRARAEKAEASLSILLQLAYQYRDDLHHPPAPDSRERRLSAIDAAIAKAETRP